MNNNRMLIFIALSLACGACYSSGLYHAAIFTSLAAGIIIGANK